MTFKIQLFKKEGKFIDTKSPKNKIINLPILHVPICFTSVKIQDMILLDPNVRKLINIIFYLF
jgi:exosome complex RNA-binding protein Rrp42 (RNase PH superfamily)